MARQPQRNLLTADDRAILHARVRLWLREHRQTDLAKLSGVSDATICRFVYNKFNGTTKLRERLERGLNAYQTTKTA